MSRLDFVNFIILQGLFEEKKMVFSVLLRRTFRCCFFPNRTPKNVHHSVFDESVDSKLAVYLVRVHHASDVHTDHGSQW